MIGAIGRRFFHTTRVHLTSSSALVKLRKSTGYSVSNCKKAVEMFPDDISKAEEWLHCEAKRKGWTNLAKIQTRSATQGIVGVYSTDKVGVMVEVNCETDFVAKNAEFQQLVANILAGCLNHVGSHPTTEDVTKTVLDETQISDIKHNSSTLGELVNSAISKFNEKTVAKRALCLKVKNSLILSGLSHPSTSCPSKGGVMLGKYGTLLVYKHSNPELPMEESLGTNICQHIIGMNPSSVGQLTEEDILNFSKKEDRNIEEAPIKTEDVKLSEETTEPPGDQEENETVGQDTLTSIIKDSEENRLLFQTYILDSNITVGEALFNSGAEIVSFERFECGETSAESGEVKESVSVGL